MHILEGKLAGEGLKIALVVSRFNSFITERLLEGALDCRGSTPHFDYVAAEVSKGIAQVSLDTGVPVLFGVLTTDTLEQAVERAGSKAGNKGYAAAEAAIEMVNLLKQMGV